VALICAIVSAGFKTYLLYIAIFRSSGTLQQNKLVSAQTFVSAQTDKHVSYNNI